MNITVKPTSSDPEQSAVEVPQSAEEARPVNAQVERNGTGRKDGRIAQLLGERKELQNQLKAKSAEINALTSELSTWRNAAQAQQRAAEETAAAFAVGLDSMRERFPDFDEVIGRLRALPADLMALIQEEECGPLLLYRMGMFPAMHYELVSLSLTAARRRIRRLCVELEQQLELKAKQDDVNRWYRTATREHLANGRAN